MTTGPDPFRPGHWIQDRLLRGLIGGLLLLPYARRVPLCGLAMRRLIGPLAGYDRRIRANLALIWPDLAPARTGEILRGVLDNAGRSVIEIYSGPEFAIRAAAIPPRGPGMAALEQARAERRPVILVTGHFGNYDASRAALIARGFRVGGLYKPMSNRYFNTHYEAAIGAIGQPIFPRGARGMGRMVRFLREGGMLGMVIDQYIRHGTALDFLGHPARTALSAAELALKYDALLVPVYGIRQPDGLGFEILVEAPIPAASPEAMTQALNDSLAALVRRYPEQWFWVHRRWKAGPEG